jgi:hypothetical protein
MTPKSPFPFQGVIVFLGEPGSFSGEPEMRQFCEHLLPYTGLYGYLGRRPKDGAVVSHGLCSILNELIAAMHLNDLQGLNCYFNLATFVHLQGVLGTDGKIHFRSQENGGARRSFGFDIDCRISKPMAHYANQEEARAAVEAMCRSEGLPSPVYVDSGGGLHGHWPVDRDLTQAEWLPHAHAIAAAMRAHGIQADRQCTVNFVGVLRPIGTRHITTGKVVKLINELVGPFPLSVFDHLVEKYRDATRRSAPRGGPAATSGYGRGQVGAAILADRFDPSDPARVVRNCQQIAALAATPKAFSEPMHRAAAGLFKHCGPNGAQFYLDKLDPDWRDSGQRKLDHWTAGPTTCTHFEAQSPQPELCKTCPHWGKITSPIQLGTSTNDKRRAAKRWQHIRRRRTYAGAGHCY